jgi:hypothetical protein
MAKGAGQRAWAIELKKVADIGNFFIFTVFSGIIVGYNEHRTSNIEY